ncbi:MAG TPA: hypothetical protein VHJ18_31065 [Streptosporangiaceae bacterium]|nr:hypothetical protein [Streptosporangiaceae bacterium]
MLTASKVTVDTEADDIPVGIDGETIMMPTPVVCTTRPQALRVLVPRNRPGTHAEKAPLEWSRLRHLAWFGTLPDESQLSAAMTRGNAARPQ